ncbi:hypothetical protein [Ferruginibacter sp.]
MNWPIIISIAVVLVALIIFLVKKNMKDEKDLEKKIKNDYLKENKDVKDEGRDAAAH